MNQRREVVRMKGIVKRFPGVLANDHVDFRLLEGEIHSLLGENGAGKTTLMNVLSGLYRPDEGQLFLYGKPVAFKSPGEALQAGIGMIHQHFKLVSQFTVAENIILGVRDSLVLNYRRIREKVAELSKTFGLEIDPGVPVSQLSVGEQQRVEILKMLFRDVRILIMDEPTAVLTPDEIKNLFKTVRFLRDKGRAVVFITHKLEEVIEISEYITVLRRGKVMSTVRPDKVQKRDGIVKSELARMMVGREVILEVGKEPVAPGGPLLEINHLSVKGDRGEVAVKDVSFLLHQREILGILGVAGNGQTELVETVVGLRKDFEGEVHVGNNRETSSRFTLHYVPEDRIHRASVPSMTIAYNMVLTCLKRFTRGIFLKNKTIFKWAAERISAFHISPPDPGRTAAQLSGGNLQKVILARELAWDPDILIVEQPTRGLDIGATEEVWQSLIAQRRRGAGILLVSGDIREILSLADRILILFRGEVMDLFPATDDQHLGNIGPLMAGFRA
ncbi:MAG: ATP-binding cassette domain-containing protein [Nitrospiraceae bacterium]|nr:ATP-binding cassette domain-containing protein [Nitrospiraceae bacterium]